MHATPKRNLAIIAALAILRTCRMPELPRCCIGTMPVHLRRYPLGVSNGRMATETSLRSLAIAATLHCLTGCAIGEILGMTIGIALGFHQLGTVVLSIVLAFVFGYFLSSLPLLAAGLPVRTALMLVLAADTLSILTMEVVDNLVMLVIPGAMNAGLANPIYWISMAVSLALAFAIALPVNRALIARGKGHALVHEFHAGHDTHAGHGALGADPHVGHDMHAEPMATGGDEHATQPRTPRRILAPTTPVLIAVLSGFLLGGFVVALAETLGIAGH